MKHLFLSILILLIPFSVYGQNDSLLREIMNYDNSKPVLISKGRSLLLDKLLADDFKKTREIKDYLVTEVADNDYAAFFPVELWLILYWTGEYDLISTDILGLSQDDLNSFTKKIKPQPDKFYDRLLSKSRESRLYLIGSINESASSLSDKEFLVLNLNYLLSGDKNDFISQEELNSQADDYLNKHPQGKYNEHIRKYIRIRYTPSDWGFGMEFFSGYGFSTGQIPDSFKNNVPFGVAFDLYYKRFGLYLRDYIGFSRTTRDIPYSEGLWEKGSQVRVFIPEASLGYLAIKTGRITAAPFAGVTAISFSPTEHDTEKTPELDEAEIGFKSSWTLGVNLDINFNNASSSLITSGREESYWFIRLRYSYSMPHLESKYYGFAGNIHSITIGVGGIGRRLKRDL